MMFQPWRGLYGAATIDSEPEHVMKFMQNEWEWPGLDRGVGGRDAVRRYRAVARVSLLVFLTTKRYLNNSAGDLRYF